MTTRSPPDETSSSSSTSNFLLYSSCGVALIALGFPRYNTTDSGDGSFPNDARRTTRASVREEMCAMLVACTTIRKSNPENGPSPKPGKSEMFNERCCSRWLLLCVKRFRNSNPIVLLAVVVGVCRRLSTTSFFVWLLLVWLVQEHSTGRLQM